MTWLVLCGHGDAVGRWAFEQLRAKMTGTVEIVTDMDLVGAAWDHRVTDDAVVTELQLADGRTIASSAILGALNRLIHAPPAMVGVLTPADREYGYAEYSALLLSWLASIEGPVLNPPTTRGLSGAWRSDLEWAVLAADVGLACVPLAADSALTTIQPPGAWDAWPPYSEAAESAIVVGEEVFSAQQLDRATRDACRALARLAGTPLLGLMFEATMDAGPPRLRGATPLPNLRAAGPPVIDVLAMELARSVPTSVRGAVPPVGTASE